MGALHRNRRTFAWKCFGVAAADMTRSLRPSTLTLAGLVKHLALVEDHYFTHQLLGQPYPEVWAPIEENDNWDFESAVRDSPQSLHAVWSAAVQRSEAATIGCWRSRDWISVSSSPAGTSRSACAESLST